MGTDLSARMLARARRRLELDGIEKYALCRADAHSLPFGASTFDVLFNLYMLDLLSIEDVPYVLREFARVLRPGGRLVVVTMAEQVRLVNALWMRLYRCLPVLVGGCRPLPIAEMLASNRWKIELREQISQCGFRSDLFVAQFAKVGVP